MLAGTILSLERAIRKKMKSTPYTVLVHRQLANKSETSQAVKQKRIFFDSKKCLFTVSTDHLILKNKNKYIDIPY